MVRKIVLSLALVVGCLGFALAQNKQITGTVTNAEGQPVVGATVTVEGTNLGTSTDANGKFAFAAPANGVLAVSFVGYEDAIAPINGKTTLDVVLQESTKSIDDVIVVAYGQAKKEAFTGSAAVLKSDDIAKSQTSNVVDALNGKVTGVQIFNSSGQPGSAPTVRVRGISSIYAGVAPLIIVDGMAFAGSINDINPSDVESMSVLKDAAAAALYGARGANGVILITTKRANSRDAIVSVDIKVGVKQRSVQDYDYVKNPAQHYEMHYSQLKNYYENKLQLNGSDAHLRAMGVLTSSSVEGLGYNVFTVPNGQSLIGTNGRFNPNATLGRKVEYRGQEYWLQPDNWTKEIYGNSVRQEYNVNIAGGSDKANFFGSFGYLNDDGIVSLTGYERYSARLRADYQAKKWLKVGGNASYAHTFSEYSTGTEGSDAASDNIFAFTSKMAPIYPLYIRDGNKNIMYDDYGNIMFDYGTSTQAGSNAGLSRPFMSNSNAYGQHLLDKHSTTSNTAAFNGFADVLLPAGFKFTFNGGVSVYQASTLETTNPLYGQYASSGGSIVREEDMSWSYTLQQLLSWHHTFCTKHNVDLLLGHENNHEMSRYVYGYKTGVFSVDSTELPQGLILTGTSSAIGEYNNEGYFFRAQYDYDERVFVSGSYRRDASSRFHPKHRWGNFWSLSAAWLLNKESWFRAPWVDELKVKASYGSQGNDSISDFLYMDQYTIRNDGTDKWAVQFSTKGNEKITWETNGNLNAGVEFAFWGYRLSGSVEYFNRITTDMLSVFRVPQSLGYSSYWKNVGDMTNQGIEIELSGTPIRTKNFSWDLNLNLTWLKNKITKLAPETQTNTFYSLDGKVYKGFMDGNSAYIPGLPIFTMYLPAYAGVDPKTGEALYYTYDTVDEDSEIMDTKKGIYTTPDFSAAKQFIFDTSLPDAYGGFGTTFRLHGFDLTVNFAYQIGGQVVDYDYAAYMSSPTSNGGVGNAYHRDLLKAWTPENPSTTIPRFQYNDEFTASISSRFITDASYLSLQNINFGYTFPQKWMGKIGVSKLRLYLACDNVWIWSQRKGLDPRQTINGLGASNSNYAVSRAISGGVNITF